jgi:hypothetical protein
MKPGVRAQLQRQKRRKARVRALAHKIYGLLGRLFEAAQHTGIPTDLLMVRRYFEDFAVDGAASKEVLAYFIERKHELAHRPAPGCSGASFHRMEEENGKA